MNEYQYDQDNYEEGFLPDNDDREPFYDYLDEPEDTCTCGEVGDCYYCRGLDALQDI